MKPTTKLPLSEPAGQLAMEECLRLLLDGIQKHLIIADETDAKKFRADLAALESQFPGIDNSRRLVDSAVEILGQYGQRTNLVIAQHKSGVITAASNATTAVEELPGMRASAGRLGWVKEKIRALSPETNLGRAKAQVRTDLAAAQGELLQERQKISEPCAGVEEKMDPSPSNISAPTFQPVEIVYPPDPVTGLHARCFAEDKLARAHAHASDCNLVLFVVKSIALIKTRFGSSQGDQVLLKVVQFLKQSLPEFENLFRWSSCALVVLAPPDETYRALRLKVQMIENTRLSPTIKWEGTSAMVPVTIDCEIIRLKDFESPYKLFSRLDMLESQVVE
jgi:GGDEF domain-containing protein